MIAETDYTFFHIAIHSTIPLIHSQPTPLINFPSYLYVNKRQTTRINRKSFNYSVNERMFVSIRLRSVLELTGTRDRRWLDWTCKIIIAFPSMCFLHSFIDQYRINRYPNSHILIAHPSVNVRSSHKSSIQPLTMLHCHSLSLVLCVQCTPKNFIRISCRVL